MTPASRARLATCHEDLQNLFTSVDSRRPVDIIQGGRTEAEEAAALANGLSATHHSKHLMNPAMAVDVTPEPYKQNDIQGCIELNEIVQNVALAMGLKIRWGGAWNGTRNTECADWPERAKAGTPDDCDHWELV